MTMAALLVCALFPPRTASAAFFGAIPSYYEHLDFNLTGPTAFTEAVGGYANPSVYPMMPGAELEFYWSSYDADVLSDARRWGAFVGLENLGFGMVHSKVRLPQGDRSVTDYRIGLGFGTRVLSTGIGYGWSGGHQRTFGREEVFQIGLTGRFGRWVSAGANMNVSTESNFHRDLYDVAVRPLGDGRLTLFADVELAYSKDERVDTTPWSAGAMVEIPSGLKVIGRYFDDETGDNRGFSVGLAYTFGTGFGQGVMRGSWVPRFDRNDDLAVTHWGLRMGYPERSTLLRPLFRNSGYLDMHIQGSPTYLRYRFFDSRTTLLQVLSAIDDAREDDRIAGVALNLSGANLTRGQAWEIRQRLEELQATGKKVVVFIDEFGMSTFYLASVADWIVMDPEGLALLPGYVMGRTFVASMAEKLGIGIEEWRFLRYKSAMESLVRHEMSDADREQRQALVDQYYATFREGLARGRKVTPETVDRWIDDVTLFTAQRALDEKLVDELGRWEELKDAVARMEGGRKQFVGPGQLERDWYPSTRWGEIPEIAVVYAIGECSMDEGIKARELEKTLRGLREDDDVKAIVLRVDSPGGSPVASDVVAGQLRRAMEKKPVVISQGDVAASGGYWLSMCSNQIVAQPTTITGSIGVISGWVWDKGLGEKMGMEGDFVEAGKHANLFFGLRPPFLPVSVPHRGVTDEERERAIDGMKELYERFVAAVAGHRSMNAEDVEALAQGRVWTGAEAKENGLVDRIGGLQDAIMVARELAGIGPRDEVRIAEYGPRGLFHLDLPGLSMSAPFASVASLSARLFGGGASAESDGMDAGHIDDYNLVYLRQLIRNNGRAQCLLPPDAIPQDGSQTGR